MFNTKLRDVALNYLYSLSFFDRKKITLDTSILARWFVFVS